MVFKWPCGLRFPVAGLHKQFTKIFKIIFFFLNINYILSDLLSNPHSHKGCQQFFWKGVARTGSQRKGNSIILSLHKWYCCWIKYFNFPDLMVLCLQRICATCFSGKKKKKSLSHYMSLVLCWASGFKTLINLKGHRARWKIWFNFRFYSLLFSFHSTLWIPSAPIHITFLLGLPLLSSSQKESIP